MFEQNQQFELAEQFVNQTGRHLFLSGKAGTGKTTFLQYIKANSPKRLAVVAPTGVAAMNAGGVTIHSFFQLPFGSFLPADLPGQETEKGNFYSRNQLLKHLKLNSAKRELMRELDLLIIDEVSMVRADLLDAIDVVLRHVRRQPNLSFGGLQLLFIGDLFQLPPVVNEEEWASLGSYYSSSFFFNAHALQQAPPLYLELKKIYRQSDTTFIDLLNKLRNNTVTAADLDFLQRFYQPDFKPEKEGEYVILTTHNAKANLINQEELKKLPGKSITFKAETSGDFNEKAVPAENELQLKEGAQIMFIRNDKGEQRRFYNGKTGIVKRIAGENIWVAFPDEKEELLVEKESWKNIRYKYKQETEEVEEEVKGTFTQYPIRLAWAITIHKSQGLTFNKAIIDAGESFAPGQVYVALSRLTSLQGLVLFSPIQAQSVLTNEQAVAFTQREQDHDRLVQELNNARKGYLHQLLLQAFNWFKISNTIEKWKESLESRRIPLEEEAGKLANALREKVLEQQKIADKFCRQLDHLLQEAQENNYAQTRERVAAAVEYFNGAVDNGLLKPLQQHLKKIKEQPKKAKKYRKELEQMILMLKERERRLEQALILTESLVEGADSADILEQLEQQKLALKASGKGNEKELKNKKPEKGETRRISLNLFREGKSVEEIARERDLVPGTIEGHLASFILSGELQIQELVPEEKLNRIQKVLKEAEEMEEGLSTSQIKELLGEEVSYGDIKAVQNYLNKDVLT